MPPRNDTGEALRNDMGWVWWHCGLRLLRRCLLAMTQGEALRNDMGWFGGIAGLRLLRRCLLAMTHAPAWVLSRAERGLAE